MIKSVFAAVTLAALLCGSVVHASNSNINNIEGINHHESTKRDFSLTQSPELFFQNNKAFVSPVIGEDVRYIEAQHSSHCRVINGRYRCSVQ